MRISKDDIFLFQNKCLILCLTKKSNSMANLNRDYGNGKEFLIWFLLFAVALVLLIIWIYHLNFRMIF